MNPVRTITFGGETLTLDQWAARINLTKESIRYRLNAGWPLEDALTKHRGKPGVSPYRDTVNAARRRYADIREAEAILLRRDFDKLVRKIDLALTAFNRRLTRGVSSVNQDRPLDR